MSGHTGSGHGLSTILEATFIEVKRRHERDGFRLGVEYGEIRAAFRGYAERRDMLLDEGKQEKIDAFYSDLSLKAQRAKQIEQDHPEVFDPGHTRLSQLYERQIEPDGKRLGLPV